jgi:uncharacterized UBP type Zn finger protein
MSLNSQGQLSEHFAVIEELKDMGFPEHRVKDALNRFNNSKEAALNHLLSSHDENDPELARACNR